MLTEILGYNGVVRFEKYYFRRTIDTCVIISCENVATANTCRLSKKVYPSKSRADVSETASSEGVERPMFSAPLADHARVFHSVAMATAHRLPGSRSQCSVCAGCVLVVANCPTTQQIIGKSNNTETTMVRRHCCSNNDRTAFL